MKDLVWDNTLSVEVDEIDEDHRKLVDLLNMLTHSIEQGDDASYIEAILDELISCTVWHFRHEERLMLKYGYDATDEHKAEHSKLIESIEALKQKFVEEGMTVSDEDIEFLEHWLTGHILGTDMELGAYLAREI